MLTVRELIQKLQTINQDACLYFECSEVCEVFPVADIYCRNEAPACYILDKPDDPEDDDYDSSYGMREIAIHCTIYADPNSSKESAESVVDRVLQLLNDNNCSANIYDVSERLA